MNTKTHYQIKRAIFTSWLGGCLTAIALPAAPVTNIDLQDGDTFVFLGDSITFQCHYTQYVEDYFYTRYPDRKIHFHNAGVGGDRVADALARFDEDVAPYKPKYVSVLLGMNDGAYTDFDAATFKTYSEDMEKLIAAIEKCGAKPILMSPTMFDHTADAWRSEQAGPDARARRAHSPLYNAVLAYYGAWGREEATKQNLPYINLWGPMNDLIMEQRHLDPKFNLIPDGIHPTPAGHVIMASAMIDGLQPDRPTVGAVGLSRLGTKWQGSVSNGTLDHLAGDAHGVSFDLTFASLPWVIPESAGKADAIHKYPDNAPLGLQLTQADHRFSSETLVVSDLPAGNYEVVIDGKSIGKPMSEVTLGSLIELQANPETPEYQQALKVAMLNIERNDKAVHPLRNLWKQIKAERKRRADQFDTYMAGLRPEMKRLEALDQQYEDQIRAAAKPVAHHYEIKLVK